MGQILLPKQYHPDFATPGRKPVGPSVLDHSNKFGSQMSYFVLAGQKFEREDSANSLYTLQNNGFNGTAFHFESTQPNRIQWATTVEATQTFTTVTQFRMPQGSNNGVYVYNVAGRLYVLMSREGVTTGWIGLAFFNGSGFVPLDIMTFEANGTTAYTVIMSTAPGLGLSGVGFKNNHFVNEDITTDTSDIVFVTSRSNSLGTLGSWGVNNNDARTEVLLHAFSPRYMNSGEIRELGRDPYQILKPATPQIYTFPSAVSGVTGNGAFTLADVTTTSTGTVDVDGTGTFTLDAVTTTSAGTVSISGDGAFTLDAVTVSSTGTSGGEVTGAGAFTLADVTTTSTGTVDIDGAGTFTLDSVTTVSAGTVAIDGAGAFTLGDVVLSSTGTVTAGITGNGAFTLSDVSVTSVGVVAVGGTSAFTLDDLTVFGSDTVALADVLIDGANTSVIATSFQSTTLYFNSENYFTIT